MATFFRIFQRYGDPSQSSKQAESYTERSRIVEDRSGARMSCGVSGTYPAGPELRRVVSTNTVFRPQRRLPPTKLYSLGVPIPKPMAAGPAQKRILLLGGKMKTRSILLSFLLLVSLRARVESQGLATTNGDSNLRVILLGTAGGPTFSAQRL